MSNAELARLLRSAASALEHGRHTTATTKMVSILREINARDVLTRVLQLRAKNREGTEWTS